MITPNTNPNYEKLKDKTWTEREYDAPKSRKDIAVDQGLTEDQVRYQMDKHGIQARTPAATHMLKRKEDGFFVDFNNIEIFNGSLLGDASMALQKKRRLPRFTKTNIHYSHLLHVQQALFRKNSIVRIKPKKFKLNGNVYPAHYLSSLGHEFLIELYKKWYPNGVKLVPRDLILTQLTVLHWFLDDGYSCYKNRNGKLSDNRVTIGLCSQSFTKEDNEFLCQLLADIGITAYVHTLESGTGYAIKISTAHSEQFFNVIGPCPDDIKEAMGYKWKNAETYSVKFPELKDYATMYGMYVIEGLGRNRIANLLGCNAALVGRALDYFQIPLRPAKRGNYKNKHPNVNNPVWLRQEYEVMGRTTEEIGEAEGCSGHWVWTRLRRFGIPLRPAKCRSSMPKKED